MIVVIYNGQSVFTKHRSVVSFVFSLSHSCSGNIYSAHRIRSGMVMQISGMVIQRVKVTKRLM